MINSILQYKNRYRDPLASNYGRCPTRGRCGRPERSRALTAAKARCATTGSIYRPRPGTPNAGTDVIPEPNAIEAGSSNHAWRSSGHEAPFNRIAGRFPDTGPSTAEASSREIDNVANIRYSYIRFMSNSQFHESVDGIRLTGITRKPVSVPFGSAVASRFGVRYPRGCCLETTPIDPRGSAL